MESCCFSPINSIVVVVWRDDLLPVHYVCKFLCFTFSFFSHAFVFFFITHADSSRGGRVFTAVCLSVYPHDTSQTDAATVIKLDEEMFQGESWKPIYFGVQRSRSRVTKKHLPAWVFALLWVLASCSYYCQSAEVLASESRYKWCGSFSARSQSVNQDTIRSIDEYFSGRHQCCDPISSRCCDIIV